MIQRKICMVGAFAVGKTNLARRYARSIYSDRYLTTVGVEIHKRRVHGPDGDTSVLLWDLAGEDELNRVRTSYLRGAAGYLLVIDGTRPATIDVAYDLQRRVETECGPIPFTVALNKADLADEWQVSPATLASLRALGWDVHTTSARTGWGVEGAFRSLLGACLRPPLSLR